MEIHSYERFWIGASFVLIVAFIATVTWGAVAEDVTMVGDADSIDPDGVDDHPDFGELPDDAVRRTGEGRYEAYVVARQFSFMPGTGVPLKVPANSTVTFHVTSPDVTHGFEVVGTNVNTMVIPGQVTTFTVEFDGPAEYGIICNEYCGSGHHLMEGRLVVVPEDEFELDGEGGTDGDGDTTSGTDGDGNTTAGGGA